MATNSRSSYQDILSEAWAQHLAPRAPDAPTVISLFAGCGGSSLGYSMAGYRELLAVEWDASAVETFKLNFPGVPVFHGDIAKLSVEDVLKRTGLQPAKLDVLDGSPPCQGFSTAGKRDMGDDRNQLFREYVRLLRGLRPKVFVMENVSGMVKGKMKLIFVEILKELKASGYKVSARLMNAMYFHVPQSRQRLIFVGVRGNARRGILFHPRASASPMTIDYAWKGANEDAPSLRMKWAAMAKLIKQGQCEADHNPCGNGFQNLVRLRADQPAPTVSRLNRGYGLATWLHPTKDRPVSIGEAKRCGSFPDEFTLMGDFETQWARIGNSVPPLFMRAIAEHIRVNCLAEAE